MKLQFTFVLVAFLACLLQSQSSFLRREYNDDLDDYLTDAERTLMQRVVKKVAEVVAKNPKKIGATIGSGAYTANEVKKEVKTLKKTHSGQYVDAKKHARSLVRLMKQLDMEDEFDDLDDYERQLMNAIKKAAPVVGAAVAAYHKDKITGQAVKGTAAMIHNTNVHKNQQMKNRDATENARRKEKFRKENNARKLFREIQSLLN